jgi:hypothetical protein
MCVVSHLLLLVIRRAKSSAWCRICLARLRKTICARLWLLQGEQVCTMVGSDMVLGVVRCCRASSACAALSACCLDRRTLMLS